MKHERGGQVLPYLRGATSIQPLLQLKALYRAWSRPRRVRRCVCVLSPGPVGSPRSGGIGSCMRNFVQELPQVDPGLEIVLIDTRGPHHIAFSPFFLFGAIVQVVALRSFNKTALLHVNVATHGSTVRKFIVALVASALRIPFVLHLHGPGYDEFYAGLGHIPQRAIRWMFARADAVITLSRHWQSFVVGRLATAPDRVVVVSNGVPRPTPAAVPATGSAPDEFHVVFLGRLGERKGVSDLLTALACPAMQDTKWRATFAGDGDASLYVDRARSLGLAERVSFAGWLDRAGVVHLLKDASALVLPSHAEGMPMAILEALAHRVPVITTPVGSIPDFLQHEDSALFVTPGRPEEIAQALGVLMHSPRARERLAGGGRQVFDQHFSAETMTRKLVAIYRQIAAWPGVRSACADKAG